MKSKNFNLRTYSAFASAFLIIGNVHAEVEYTNIEPDIVLDSDWDSEGVDMDNNGALDFAFLNFSYSWNTFGYSFIERIFAGPYGTPLNEIAGSQNFYYFAYALNFGDTIGTGLTFQNYGFQLMAWRIFHELETWGGDILYFTGEGGFWYPEMLNHYLGVHFIDENADYHYGWIRCDVKDEGRTLVIKDYAYEKFIDHEIIAGDTLGYQPFGHDTIVLNPGTEIENILSGSNIYSFESTIYIKLPVLSFNLKVRVYDLNGSEIYEDRLQSIFSEIKVNEPNGLYLVEIIDEKSRFTKKVYLE